MMILTALGYAMVFVLLIMVTVFISAKIESKITFKEIIDGFKRRWERSLWLLFFFFLFLLLKSKIRENYMLYYERIDTRKGSEVWRSKHHWKLIEKEIIVKTMHEARSKDELYRKIYHEPEGNIGVLRVKLMYSLLFFFEMNL